MSYVPFILKNVAANLKLTIGVAYIGGCTLAQHYANFTGETIELDGTSYAPKNYSLSIYKPDATSWENVGSMSETECISYADWDIITFQQGGIHAAKAWETYYAPYIFRIQREVFNQVQKPIKLGWISIQGAYASDSDGLKSKWIATTANTELVQNKTGNQVVFPFGTAVQNLSTIQNLAEIGDGVGMTADGGHLHEGLPCLVAAYANALTILREANIEGKSIIGESTRPTKDWCDSIGVMGANYGDVTNDVVGISEENCYLAQIAAIQAIKKPYEITDISIFFVV
jgi:hypothetical protein